MIAGSPLPPDPPASTSALIFALQRATAYGPLAGRVEAICHDSRAVTPGSAFVAVPGDRVDGHAYLAQAVAGGAGMLVVRADRQPQWERFLYTGVSVVSVPDTREALGRLAAAFYGHPSRHLTVVGVTGTNGKTTTAFLTAGVLGAAGRHAAMLTTAGSSVGGRFRPNDQHVTTPDVVAVHRFLAQARAAGAAGAVIECTSHGLDQGRLAEVAFDSAVVTNLDSDHLDYHGDRAAYRLAKARLFEMLPPDGTAVVNADDPEASWLAERSRAGRLSYGIDSGADVSAEAIAHRGWRTSYRLRFAARTTPVRLELPGRFNVYNSLAAAAVAAGLGIDLDQIRRGLGSVTEVPGRMHRVRTARGFTVVVDYAHNAHGMRQALSFLRTTTTGRLIAVFGSAGERDPARRPEMARVAAELADYTVVTTEDSWDEDPQSIVDGVVEGLLRAGRRPDLDYAVRLDRREAIELALSTAGPGDTVLVAGMGHESTMMVSGVARPWDDRLVIRDLLRERPRRSGRRLLNGVGGN